MGLHFILQNLDSPETYAQVLFVYFSLEFNTVIRAILKDSLSQLTVQAPTSQWICNFLTNKRQLVAMESIISEICTISTGAPPGMCSLLFYSLHQQLQFLLARL